MPPKKRKLKPESDKLTDQQKMFADYFVFFGLDADAAMDYAGYKFTGSPAQVASNRIHRKTELLGSKRVLSYINKLRKEVNNQLIVDKLWVTKKLKNLADVGSENVQLKATELLGKTLDMFNTKQTIEINDSASKVVEKAREKRRNMLIFKKENEDGDHEYTEATG